MAVGTFANGLSPKEAAAVVTKAEVKKATSLNKSEAKKTETEKAAFRRQMAFQFYDNCGQMLTVWVSAGNSVSNASMAQTAYNYACGYANAGGGCF
ncbi:hypothetical protein SAMN04488524_1872 [Pedobacter africanus]|uniref:Uncharacterized protein n=2 Tax=Pedobacter africanus TaxID=151894 RepID=A0A1W2B3X7_9SPHI|nr:hypothetical protein SAMN04488524_1872 [Pedobacter africanus]